MDEVCCYYSRLHLSNCGNYHSNTNTKYCSMEFIWMKFVAIIADSIFLIVVITI